MIEEFLNEYAEVHAFGIGLYEGLTDVKTKKGWISPRFDGLSKVALRNKDVREEPHYARGGYFLGAIIRMGFILIILYMFLKGGY